MPKQMTTGITAYLMDKIEEQAQNCRAGVAAASKRIADAESLAQRLQSAGIPANAFGDIQGAHILLWVTAGPVHADRLEKALTRLDMTESNRFPGVTEWGLRLHGIDVPLYVMPPSIATTP